MDPFSRPVWLWRWGVFGLAAFFCLQQVVTADYSHVGGPFRFLTIWALFVSFYSASRMLAYTERRILHCPDVLPSVAAVLNLMVVYLYWRLYLTDPALLRGDAAAPAWWEDWYLHGLGPLLQWIDALLVRRAFRRPWAALGMLFLVILAYVAWTEGFVGPMNDSPARSVTSGLPYPFLNDMTWEARVKFYAVNAFAAAAALGAFVVLARAIRQPDRREGA